MLMAMNGNVNAHGSGSRVLLARAMRNLKGKVQFLIQHGRLAAPRARRAVLGMLDRFIVPINFDERTREGASWHPKICLIEYSPDAKAVKGQQSFWKLWIGSRNFTRDGSWDIGFSLSSDPAQNGGQLIIGVDTLAGKLAGQARKQAEWAKALSQLKSVRWQVPKGMKVRAVHLLLPKEERHALPEVPTDVHSVLAVAPFIEAGELRRLAMATPGASRTLVSLEESIAVEARQAGWADMFALHYLPPGSQDVLADDKEASGDDEEPEMGGLHAKFLWFEHRDGATLHLGSPNLTERGWRRSAEAYVTLDIARPGSSAAAKNVYEGMARFRASCARVDVSTLPQPVDNAVEQLLEQQRKMLAASLGATQRLEPDQTVTITSAGSPALGTGVSLSISRIGDIAVPWPSTSTPLVLPAAPRYENSDFLHLVISAGGQEVAWLQHAPFVPPLGEAERDLPLLQSFLGLNGLLDWLAEVLAGAGDGSGKGRDWDDNDTKKPQTKRAESLPFSVEAVLAAWVRDPATLKEARAVMEMARGYAGNDQDDHEARARLRSFLKSWAVLEAHLR
ncbi:hypothetical protein FBX97_3912 [Herbaspirillum sp. SJZ107]|nr:hypothetical protein FBX97_3912 [Herbaspirillum sp. SJZ107]